jgi:hypothetical protein
MVIVMVMMMMTSILTHSLLPALSIHILLTYSLSYIKDYSNFNSTNTSIDSVPSEITSMSLEHPLSLASAADSHLVSHYIAQSTALEVCRSSGSVGLARIVASHHWKTSCVTIVPFTDTSEENH